MSHTTSQSGHHEALSTQEIALHMIASAARVLLMIGTAVLVGEVAAGPAKRLITARRHNNDQSDPSVSTEASTAGGQ